MSYFLAFLGFAALIILHEAGHFVAAKAVGMRVERFSLFFGPMPFKRTIGETEYGIGVIPLGGYVKITGMSPEEVHPEADQLTAATAELQRTQDELTLVRAEGTPGRLTDLEATEREQTAVVDRLRAQVHDIHTRGYYNQPVWKRIVVIAAGPAVNLLIAFLIVWGLFLQNGQNVSAPGATVVAIEHASPASGVLKAGDDILSVNGAKAGTAAFTKTIAADRCAGPQVNGCAGSHPVEILLRRRGRLLTEQITPRYNIDAHRQLVGFDYEPNIVNRSVSATHAASLTITGLWNVTEQTVSKIGKIFQAKDRKQIHGVVGGYTVVQKSFAQSPSLALEVLALISLSLAVINLFPFLPLDGGHIFWAVAEKVRGRRIPFAVMERAGLIGFALIIGLFVVGLTNDISTLSGKGFNVP